MLHQEIGQGKKEGKKTQKRKGTSDGKESLAEDQEPDRPVKLCSAEILCSENGDAREDL